MTIDISTLKKLNEDQSYRLSDFCQCASRDWIGSLSGQHTIDGIIQYIPTLVDITGGVTSLTEKGKAYVINHEKLTVNPSQNNYRTIAFTDMIKNNKLDVKKRITSYRNSGLIDRLRKGDKSSLVYLGLADLKNGIVIPKEQSLIDGYIASWDKKQASYKKSQAKKASNMKLQLELINLKDDNTIESLQFRANEGIKITLSNNSLYYGSASFKHFADTNMEAFTDFMALAVPIWLCKELADSCILCEDNTVKTIYRKCLTRYTDKEKEKTNA